MGGAVRSGRGVDGLLPADGAWLRRQPLSLSALRILALSAVLTMAGVARAQTTDLVVTITPAVAPLRSGVTHLVASRLSADVLNRRSGVALRHITFQLPLGYTARSTAPAPSGWRVYAASGRTIEFRTTDCAQPGIPTGGTGTFLIDLNPPTGDRQNDATSEALTLTNAGDDNCTGIKYWSVTTPTFARRVLQVTGAASPTGTLTGPASVTVTWTVVNRSNQRKNPVVLENRAIAGLTAACAPASLNLAAGRSGTFTCTYANVPSGAYTFAASASAGTSATAVGSTVTFRAGAPRVTWARPYVVRGRAPYSLSFTVVNDSGVALSRFTVARPSASWTGMSSTTTGATCNATAGTCSYGALAAGATATVNVSFTGIPSPTGTTPYDFSVVLTPTTGSPVAFPQTVSVVVPLPDVTRLTIHSDASGQTLAWTNTDGSGTPHDGVVILRTPAGTVPPLPTDFVDYTVSRPAEVIYADGEGSTTNTIADPSPGAYWYRVCNRDKYLVYSGCRTGFWSNGGYLDSALPPAGGWTHQLGWFASLIPGILPGNRVGIPTNRPEVHSLDLETGHRTFDPFALASLPASSTPATRVADGRLLLFAADASGTVTAVDLGTGVQAWPSPRLSTSTVRESFVAGVSGITRAYAAPAFQTAYSMDVLLLASVTTITEPGKPASTTGHLIALDATTGNQLWTIDTGSALRAAPVYDPGLNRIFVPTSSAGVLAYEVTGSTPGTGANDGTAPAPVSGWKNPGGSFTLYCIRTFQADSIGCIDRTGRLLVLDRNDGTVRTELATGLSSPSTLTRVVGTTPGFVVGGLAPGNVSSLQRIVASGTPLTLRSVGTFSIPGSTLGYSAITFSSDGFVVVSASDRKLHKLSLADATELDSRPVPTAVATASLGAIAYDSVNRLFIVGASDGRVSAIPRF